MKINIQKILEAEFSLYLAPIMNKVPDRSIRLSNVYGCVKELGELATSRFRKLTDPDQIAKSKRTEFAYITVSGEFKTRKAEDLIKHSGIICIDVDNLGVDEFAK